MLFLLTVGTALSAAEKHGDSRETQQLQTVYQVALDVIQEGLPPELRLVNELLAASYPEKTEELLQKHIADLDDAFHWLRAVASRDHVGVCGGGPDGCTR